MRISKVARFLVSALLIVAILGLLNAAASYALVPHGSKSEIAWTDFEAEDAIDTLYIGTSITEHSFDPYALDEHLGTRSFNLATPDQTLEESLLGIRSAYERFGIKRVVMALQFTCLQEGLSNKPGDAFMSNRARFVPLQETLASDFWLLTSKNAAKETASLNMPFPWIFNHVGMNFNAIASNVEMKRTRVPLAQAAQLNEPGYKYVGKGYGNHTGTLDYNSDAVALFGEVEDIESLGIDPMKVQTLHEICEYCSSHEIELVCVGAPVPVFNILAYRETYFPYQQVMIDALAKYGIAYHDFNLAKPELFATSHEYFTDNLHLNFAGTEAFDKSFMTYLDMRKAGQDVDGLFYTPKEFLDSIDYIDATMTDAVSLGDAVKVSARALAGPKVEVQYQYWVSYDGQNWQLVQDYSDHDTCTFVPQSRGVITVRACARRSLLNVDYEYYQDATLLY